MRSISRWITLALVGIIAGCSVPDVGGKENYLALCADCHGPKGLGDGPTAKVFKIPAANLTTLSARNGGEFPQVYVLSKIYGFSEEVDHFGAMPEFGPILDGPTTVIETEKGIFTPTPLPLVELGEYIESLQKK